MNARLDERFERIVEAARMAALGFIGLLPGAAWPEGAVRFFDCTAARVCDSAGNCRAESMQATFRMEPVEMRADGSGSYTLSYGDTQAAMEGISDAGPFFWTVGTQRNTLLASSETAFLWHRLTVDPTPEATIHFLTCTFR
jgi:hypothetical protein